jgi:hypothetical protein
VIKRSHWLENLTFSVKESAVAWDKIG